MSCYTTPAYRPLLLKKGDYFLEVKPYVRAADAIESALDHHRLAPARPSLNEAFAWSVFQHWGTRAVTFVTFFVLARLLPPVDFGLVAVSSIVLGVTEIFIDQGFSDAVVQCDVVTEAFLSTAFWVNIAVALLLIVLVQLCAGFIAHLFKEPRLALVIRVLSITFLFTALSSVQTALLRRKLDYQALAFRMMAAVAISGVMACAMAFLGAGVWSLVTQQLLYSFIAMAIVWRQGSFKPSLQVERQSLQRLLHFGLSLSGTKLIDLLHTKLIDSLVGICLGAEELGLYSVGNRLGIILMQLLGTSYADISLSHFSDLRREKAHLANAYLRMVKRVTLSSVPVFAFLALESRNVIHLFFGKRWDGTGPIFAAYCTAGMAQVVLYFTNSVVTAVGRPGIQMNLSLLKLALYAAAFFICLSHGMVVIAWSLTAVTILIMMPVTFVVIARLVDCRVADILVQIAKPYVFVLLASAMAWSVIHCSHLPYVVELLAAGAVFFTSLLALLLGFDKEIRVLGYGMVRRARYRP